MRERSLVLAAALLCLLAGTALGATRKITLTESTYKKLLVSGQKVGDVVFGELTQRDGKTPILANDYEAGVQLDTPDISQAPDHTSIFQIGKELYATILTDFFPPSTHYLARLAADGAGDLRVKRLTRVDWSSWGGVWLPCSGYTLASKDGKSVTVLNGEEYEVNARHIAEATSLEGLRAAFETDAYYYGYADVVNFMRYFGKYPFANNLSLPLLTIEDVKTLFKPYLYGYITSLEVKAGGKAKASKLLTTGRFSHEFGYVMPDRRTMYMTDDHGSGGGFFKFVASRAGDFTSGRLYAAKVTQTSPAGGDPAQASFDVEWLLLGTANNADLRAKAKATSFTDIFDTAAGNASSGACPSGYGSVNTATGYECLKVKAGREVEAAFFETRRYAGLQGATTEWSKPEGMAYDAASGSLYISMSSVRYGMEDNKRKGGSDRRYDIGGPNHVRLAYNPCGCIFKLTSGGSRLSGVVCGKPASDAAGNSCSPGGIAGPDNLDIAGGQLIIAEDSEGAHVHNQLWSMDLASGSLTHAYSVPAPGPYSEAEFTSTYVYHLAVPLAGDAKGKVSERAYLVTNINNWDFNGGVPGQVGYFGPFKLAPGDTLRLAPVANTTTTSGTSTSSSLATRRAARELTAGAGADPVAAAVSAAGGDAGAGGVAGGGAGAAAGGVAARLRGRSRGWPDHESEEDL